MPVPAPEPAEPEEPQPEEKPEEKPEEERDLRSGLRKTRFGLFEKIKSIFSSRPTLDAELAEELEALLVSSDLGVKMVDSLMSSLKEEIGQGKQVDQDEVRSKLKRRILDILSVGDAAGAIDPLRFKKEGRSDPLVVLVVGINGVGKTTSVAKLAHQFKQSGAKVMLAAADTFRAAAVEQLKEWASRIEVSVVAGAEDAKPATVVFDAMVRAKNEGADVLIIDTAGRLHTKSNLMQELEGVRNAITRHLPDAPHETLLVVDGTTGQNALSQAREFHSAVPLSGIVVTKLDGTPKGGIVVAIKDELGIPIRYIGVGEGKKDLKPFIGESFVEAIFDISGDGEIESSSKLSEHAETRRRRREAAPPEGEAAASSSAKY
ncbi:MAG: signal recognition particle-docking protein FtsY [Deltaproteobacteria bacterium]|nr:signal recognition particle-docking protein FtsY [Deltaproteobacteria bacterium]